MTATFLKSKRGKNLLVSKGFLYQRHSTKKGRTYWVCTRKPECTARATTVGDPQEVLREGQHSHAPDQDEIEARRIVNGIKQASTENPEMPPVQITSNRLENVPVVVLAKLPTEPTLKRTIQRTRTSTLPPSPKSIQEIGEIPEEFQKTHGGDSFLMWDSLRDADDDDDEQLRQNRILIFGTKANLQALSRSSTWFVDGTFKVSPTIFTQLFTVHGMFRGVAFPYVYALLPNKDQQSYNTVLDAIYEISRDMRIDQKPDTVISDFEQAIINAVSAVFPAALIRLCLFHLGQSVYRHFQSLGLQAAYSDPDNREVKVGVHMLISTAFVPADDIVAVFTQVSEAVPDELDDLVKYFEKTYIRRPVRGGRGGARYGRPMCLPELWNQYGAAREAEPRTNNLTEGWHRRFNALVGKSHPSLFSLVREMQKEQANTERKMNELELAKVVSAPQRLKYRVVTERLQRISLRYEEYKEEDRQLDYVRTCGHNLTL